MDIWVRFGDEVRSFKVRNRKRKQQKVMVQEIADSWRLDPSSMTIGEHVLGVRRKGLDLRKMKRLASMSGLGNGDSCESAIEVTGFRRELTPTELLMAEAERQRMCEEEAREREEEAELELEVIFRRLAAMHAAFYGPGCMYEYVRRIESTRRDDPCFEERLFKEIKPFIGTLHVLSSVTERVEDGNCIGMATLWKLDGSCFTAYECVKNHNNKLFFVSFQHLQAGESVIYQCKVKDLESWALLEPVEQKKFTSCMTLYQVIPAPLPLYTFTLEGGVLKEVKAYSIWSSKFFQTILPHSRMHTLGAPLVHHSGKLCGIVTGFTDLESQPRFNLHPFSSDKRLVNCTTISELESRLHSFIYEAEGPDLLEGLKSKQLISATWTAEHLVSPVEQWLLDHPLEEFD